MNDNWIPVSERLPERGKIVLVHWRELDEALVGIGYLLIGTTDWWTVSARPRHFDAFADSVTHWQPLPALPTQTFDMNQFDPLFGKQAENDVLLKDETKPTQTL